MTLARTGCRLAVLGALGSLLLIPRSVSAQAVAAPRLNFEVTSTTLAGWHSVGYGELFERLNLSATRGPLRLGLRWDSATFVSPPPTVQDRYTIEKVWLGWNSRALELIAGDAYVSFGRGLALSLRKVDELGVDTTLRGVKALLHHDRVGATLAVGFTNINNVDEASGKSIDDPLDLIAGTRVEVTAPSGATIGLHGTAVAFKRSLGLVPGEDYAERFYQVGPTFDAPRLADWLGLYLEGMAQFRHQELAADLGPAYAFYGSSMLYFGAVTVVAESKIYGDIEPIKPRVAYSEFGAIAYSAPPTLERLLQLLENPQRRIAGGRVRADWKATPTFTSFANFGLFLDRQGYANPNAPSEVRPGWIFDPYFGIEVRPLDGRSWLMAAAGVRSVFLDESGPLVRRDVHVEVDATQSLGHELSATLHAIHEQRLKYESQILDRRYREGTILVGLKRRAWGSVAAGYDYTTDPTQPKRDYFNGSAEWNITTSSSVRLFVGGTRGGLRCMSGVCRVFPPFEGVKLSVTLRF